MVRSLITGGAGFLGSHMCDRLIAEGHQVICVDNLITGSKENIAHLLENKNFTFIEHDVTEPLQVDGDLDHILHFASPASPKDYMKYPIETLKVGAFGTYNMLELARGKKATFLLASTSEVYGDPRVNPQPEDYWGDVNPVGYRSVYDEAKRFAEALTMAYYRYHKLDIRIARIFNTYGPRMRADDGRVIPTFITQALSGKPFTVFGDGTQTRSFCYVDDLIEGVYRLATYKDLSGAIINLGNPEETTIIALAKLIKQLVSSTSSIVFHHLPENDPKRRCPDISVAKNLLNWQPKISLSEGLKYTIAYFRRSRLQ